MKPWYSLYGLLLFLFLSAPCRSAVPEQAAPARAVADGQQQEPANGDTLSRVFFPGGRLQQLVIKKDSGDLRELIYTFYENGVVREKGHQGHYAGKAASTGMYAGTWYRYDTTGKLQETTTYHNDVPARAFIEKTIFYANGNMKAIQRFNNYELYESEIDSIGDWKYFDEKGKLTRTIHHRQQH